MRLSVVCMFKKTVNGYIFGGKHRLVKQVTRSAIERQREEFAREDRIMKLLRYPYLTKAESSGHARELKKSEIRMQKLIAETQQSGLRRDITIVERLYHLTHGDKWD